MVSGGKAGGGAGYGGAAGVEEERSTLESRYWRMLCEKWKGMMCPLQRGLGMRTWVCRCVGSGGG